MLFYGEMGLKDRKSSREKLLKFVYNCYKINNYIEGYEFLPGFMEKIVLSWLFKANRMGKYQERIVRKYSKKVE